MSLDTKQKLEVVDYAISIIKGTRDDKWCSFTLEDEKHRHCALGHFIYEYTDERVKKHRCYQEETLFLSYLDEIISSIVPVNVMFKQATEKERTLAMLFYLRSLIIGEDEIEITYVEPTEIILDSVVAVAS